MRSNIDHKNDCLDYPFDRLPRSIFLDTNIIDICVKWPEYIFEQRPVDELLPLDKHDDIDALSQIFFVGQRAAWDMRVSHKTISELAATRDFTLRERLIDYGVCFIDLNDTELHSYANDLSRKLVNTKFVSALPDMADRELLAHAIAMQCDVFCTRDIRSIHSRRNSLKSVPIRILTPREWWLYIRPWAGLWI